MIDLNHELVLKSPWLWDEQTIMWARGEKVNARHTRDCEHAGASSSSLPGSTPGVPTINATSEGEKRGP